MDDTIVCYLLNRGIGLDDIKNLHKKIAEIQVKEKNVLDLDFQKYILFNYSIRSEDLTKIIYEMNVGNNNMVNKILMDNHIQNQFSAQDIVNSFDLKNINDKEREQHMWELYSKAITIMMQQKVYTEFKNKTYTQTASPTKANTIDKKTTVPSPEKLNIAA